MGFLMLVVSEPSPFDVTEISGALFTKSFFEQVVIWISFKGKQNVGLSCRLEEMYIFLLHVAIWTVLMHCAEVVSPSTFTPTETVYTHSACQVLIRMMNRVIRNMDSVRTLLLYIFLTYLECYLSVFIFCISALRCRHLFFINIVLCHI